MVILCSITNWVSVETKIISGAHVLHHSAAVCPAERVNRANTTDSLFSSRVCEAA